MSDVLEISSFILAGVLVLAISWALRGKWRRLENKPVSPAIRSRR